MMLIDAFTKFKNYKDVDDPTIVGLGIRRASWPDAWEYINLNNHQIHVCPTKEMIKERKTFGGISGVGWDFRFDMTIADICADDWEVVNH